MDRTGTAEAGGGVTYWMERGLSRFLANGLERVGIHTMEDLAALTREEFVAFDGLGEGALKRCEALLGRRFPSARKEWIARGLRPWAAWKLSFSRILTLEDLSRYPAQELQQLGLNREDIELLDRLASGKV